MDNNQQTRRPDPSPAPPMGAWNLNSITADVEPLFLRPDEVASLLRISRAMVYKLISQGELPCVRIGRTARIPMMELRAWARRQVEEQDSVPILL